MNEELNGHDPSEDQPTLILLDDIYEPAFLGPDMSVNHLPRASYSLPMLASIEGGLIKLGKGGVVPDGMELAEAAQNSIGEMVHQVTSEHGDNAPIFIDDSMTRPPEKPKTKIIRPRGFRR